MTEKYHGWTNYETWSVALLIDNEQHSLNYWHSVAKDCLDGAEPDGTFSAEELAAIDMAERLRSEHEQANPLADQCTVYAQLLQGALSRVDWMQVARHYVWDV